LSTLVLGSIGIDDIETPFEKVEGILGGSAGYAAVACSFFAPSRMVSIVGEDFTDDQRRLFTSRGIDLDGLETAPGKTFRWGGRYLENFDERETVFTDLNVLAELNPNLPEAYRESRFVLLGNTDPTQQLKVLDQVTDPEVVVVDTMNFWLDSQRDLVDEVLARANVVVVNEEEARMISGHHSIPRSALEMLDMGLDAVIIKQGAYGAVLRTAEEWFFSPAYPLLEVRDPTGAGDSFAGALTGYLAREGELTDQGLREAVVRGSVAASFSVEGFGLESLLNLTEQQMKDRYAEFLRFSRVELDFD
jgi:cytidine kinase